jgi:hypothetical protein
MSFYANPFVIIHVTFHCTNCGWADVEVMDDGDRVVSDHLCGGEYDDEDY